MTKINPLGPEAPFIPKGVIFDMDGLLLDTERLEIGLFVELSNKMGWHTSENVLRNTIGVSDTDAQIFYKNKYGADYPFREIWKAVIEEEERIGETEGLPLKKGLLILLDKLDTLGIPAIVATSAVHKRAQWKLKCSGILDRFKTLTCGNEVENGKPAPDIFLLAAKKLGAKPESCVGFEDSPAGLTGLAKAGIPSVFIKDLAEPSPEILNTVCYQCSDLGEAAQLFG